MILQNPYRFLTIAQLFEILEPRDATALTEHSLLELVSSLYSGVWILGDGVNFPAVVDA